MARTAHHSPSSKQVLILLSLGLLFVSLLPSRFLRWAAWSGDVVTTVVTPVSDPVSRFGHWVAPARREARQGDIDQLTIENEGLRLQRDRFARRVERLEETVRRLQGGIGSISLGGARLLEAAITSRTSDLTSGVLVARAGNAQGVTTEAVAAAATEDYQLVGRVIHVGPRICHIRPITTENPERIRGRIEAVEEDGRGPYVSLEATGDRSLEGPVGVSEDPLETFEIAVGQRVRLDDPAWPVGAQGLLIGRVTEVRTDPDDPQRNVVEVTPDLRLDRVGQVVLRIPDLSDDAEEDGS
ncbi:MAG: rod shape-determining protein MreC [Planctomycetota bacterium]